jgi:hypothetical protein
MCAEERDRRVSERWHPASAPLAAVLHAPLPLDVEHDPQIPCRDTTSHRQLRTPAHTCPSNPLALPSFASLPRPPRPPRLAATRPADACPAPACAACPHFVWHVEEGGSSAKRWTPLPRKPRRRADLRPEAGRRPVDLQGSTTRDQHPRAGSRTRRVHLRARAVGSRESVRGLSALVDGRSGFGRDPA